MAPEQAVDASRATAPTVDVYQLGAILYQGLAGMAPFQGGTLVQVLLLVSKAEPTPPSQLQEGVPVALQGVCQKAMSKAPAARYQSALALAEDLDRFLAGEAVNALPRTSSERLARAVRRAPSWLRLASAATVVAILVATALAFVLSAPARNARRLLAECRAFDAKSVAPYALGLGPGKAPTTDDVTRYQAQLDTARDTLSAEELTEVDRLAARLRAVAIVQSGKPQPNPTSSWERLAVSRVHAQHGDFRAAVDGLTGLRDTLGADRSGLAELYLEVARSVLRSTLKQAPSAPGDLGATLAPLVSRLDPDDVKTIRRAALESTAPAWAKALQESKTRLDVRKTLTRLVAAAPPGPSAPLGNALMGLMTEWVKACDSSDNAQRDAFGRIYELAPLALRFSPTQAFRAEVLQKSNVHRRRRRADRVEPKQRGRRR
jgi:hypothetical protein